MTKKSIFIIILLSVTAAAVVLIYAVMSTSQDNVQFGGRTEEVPETPEACQEAGGEWQFSLGGGFCNFKAADAGKPCTDSDQCEGQCIAENEVATAGRCSEFRQVFGCYIFVENGKSQPPVCLD